VKFLLISLSQNRFFFSLTLFFKTSFSLNNLFSQYSCKSQLHKKKEEVILCSFFNAVLCYINGTKQVMSFSTIFLLSFYAIC
jgi:hypothetical protein